VAAEPWGKGGKCPLKKLRGAMPLLEIVLKLSFAPP